PPASAFGVHFSGRKPATGAWDSTHGEPVSKGGRNEGSPSSGILETPSQQKGFSRAAPGGGRLDGLDLPEGRLEELHQLAIAAAVENLANQRPVGFQV